MEHVYFHDNVIKKVEYDKKTLTLHFDWYRILETHPNNETDTYKKINNGVIYFEKVKVITSHWHDYTKAFANAFEKSKKTNEHGVYLKIAPDDVEIHSIDFLIALNNLVITDLKVVKAGDKYICKIDGSGCRDFQYKDGDRKVTFKYSDSYECFNTDS